MTRRGFLFSLICWYLGDKNRREDFFNKLKDAASLADNKFKELLEKENENKRTDRVKDKTNDYKIWFNSYGTWNFSYKLNNEWYY